LWGIAAGKIVESGLLFPYPDQLQISDFELTFHSVRNTVHEVHNSLAQKVLRAMV
jgi:hypothetical protein